MENVLLTVHLIVALLLIGVVLLQRSEGGGLLSGGGAMTARGATNAMQKLTWVLAAVFIATSLTLTIIAAQKARQSSVLDRTPAGSTAPVTPPTAPIVPGGDLLPPPAPDSAAPAAPATAPADAPVTPPAADATAPVTPPAADTAAPVTPPASN